MINVFSNYRLLSWWPLAERDPTSFLAPPLPPHWTHQPHMLVHLHQYEWCRSMNHIAYSHIQKHSLRLSKPTLWTFSRSVGFCCGVSWVTLWNSLIMLCSHLNCSVPFELSPWHPTWPPADQFRRLWVFWRSHISLKARICPLHGDVSYAYIQASEAGQHWLKRKLRLQSISL